jgi:hypothetical protein
VRDAALVNEAADVAHGRAEATGDLVDVHHPVVVVAP